MEDNQKTDTDGFVFTQAQVGRVSDRSGIVVGIGVFFYLASTSLSNAIDDFLRLPSIDHLKELINPIVLNFTWGLVASVATRRSVVFVLNGLTYPKLNQLSKIEKHNDKLRKYSSIIAPVLTWGGSIAAWIAYAIWRGKVEWWSLFLLPLGCWIVGLWILINQDDWLESIQRSLDVIIPSRRKARRELVKFAESLIKCNPKFDELCSTLIARSGEQVLWRIYSEEIASNLLGTFSFKQALEQWAVTRPCVSSYLAKPKTYQDLFLNLVAKHTDAVSR